MTHIIANSLSAFEIRARLPAEQNYPYTYTQVDSYDSTGRIWENIETRELTAIHLDPLDNKKLIVQLVVRA